jgi:predicted nucleic acid-binding protein
MRRYWDSSCFFDVLQDGRPNTEDARQVWAAAADGEVKIITSAATVAEVSYLSTRHWQALVDAGEMGAADDWKDAEPQIEKLWLPSSRVGLVDLSEAISQQAAALVRWARFTIGRKLTPIDAIHIATADVEGLHIHTSDRLTWMAEHRELPVTPPTWETPRLFPEA